VTLQVPAHESCTECQAVRFARVFRLLARSTCPTARIRLAPTAIVPLSQVSYASSKRYLHLHRRLLLLKGATFAHNLELHLLFRRNPILQFVARLETASL